MDKALRRLLFLIGIAVLTTQGQGILAPIFQAPPSSGPGPVPVFESSTLGAGTEWGNGLTATNSVLNLVAGTSTCGNHKYCLFFAQPISSGNGAAFGYSYSAASSEAPTATDDQANSYTCIAEVHDSTNARFMGACYAFNLTNAPREIILTFPADVSYGQAEGVEAKNLGSLRGSATGTGASSTTIASGSVSAQQNDLVVHFAQIDNPSNSGGTGGGSSNSMGTPTWTANWKAFAWDYRDGMSGELFVPTSAGSVTPSITDSISVSSLSVALDFATTAQGTDKTGEYVTCLWESNSAEAVSPTSVTPQFPCPAGTALHFSANGGSTAATPGTVVTNVTDSNATWFHVGGTNFTRADGCAVFSAGLFGCDWYAVGWTPINAEAPTLTVNWHSGTGDISIWAEAIAGATSIPQTALGSFDSSASIGAVSSFNLTTTYQPQASQSLTFVQGGETNNTSIGQSGCSTDFLLSINGGENTNGPWMNNENNYHGVCLKSDNSQQTWTQNFTDPTTTVAVEQYVFSSLPSSTAQWPLQQKNCQSTANGLGCAITQVVASDSLVAFVGSFNSTARTLTSVCNNGATCGAGHAMTCDSGTYATNGGGGAGYICHFFNTGLSGAQTWTVTWSGTVSNNEIAIYEVNNISAVATVSAGSNPAVTNSSGTQSCPSLTPNVTPTFIVSGIVTTGVMSGIGGSSLFTVAPGVFGNTADAWSAQETTVTSAQTPTYSGSGTTGCNVEAFN